MSDRPLHGLILRSRPAWDCVSKDEASAAPVSDLSGTLVVRDAMRSRMAPHDEGVVLADRCVSRNWLDARHKPRVPAAFARGVRQMKTGGAERRAVDALDKRWVTTRRSSLGDFGHSRLALRREGSDRHRGCYPTDPTGEGCPSFRRDRFPPSLRAEFSCPGGRCSIQSGAQGCPCLPARMKTHLPQSRRMLSPRPTLPVTLSGSMGERPSPSRLKALSDTAPA